MLKYNQENTTCVDIVGELPKNALKAAAMFTKSQENHHHGIKFGAGCVLPKTAFGLFKPSFNNNKCQLTTRRYQDDGVISINSYTQTKPGEIALDPEQAAVEVSRGFGVYPAGGCFIGKDDDIVNKLKDAGEILDYGNQKDLYKLNGILTKLKADCDGLDIEIANQKYNLYNARQELLSQQNTCYFYVTEIDRYNALIAQLNGQISNNQAVLGDTMRRAEDARRAREAEAARRAAETAAAARAQAAQAAAGIVTIYQHCGYNGWSVTLGEGDYDLWQLIQRGFVNDDASSLRFHRTGSVTIYEHGGFQGRSVTFTGDVPCFVEHGMNDTISAIRVRAQSPNVVTIYQHCNYGGWAVSLPAGRYDLGDLQRRGFVNDDASSLRFHRNGRITIYEHGGFQGRSASFTGDVSCFVNHGFNDIVSSVVVEAW